MVKIFIYYIYVKKRKLCYSYEIFYLFIYLFIFTYLDRVLGLKSAKISSIEPSSRSTIKLGTDILKINYEIPISLSKRNITIYQVNGTNILIRQSTSGKATEFCSIDSNTVYLKVLPSTFNVPNGEYHVAIEPNFVMNRETNEPIERLQHLSWILLTGIYYSIFL